VRKTTGKDSGRLYALKVVQKNRIMENEKRVQHMKAEREVFDYVGGCPFLTNLHYAFQTKEELYLVLGEYTKLSLFVRELYSSCRVVLALQILISI
jgi:serine/threonine protein kinase